MKFVYKFVAVYLLFTVLTATQSAGVAIQHFPKITNAHYMFGSADIYLVQHRGGDSSFCDASVKIVKGGKVLYEKEYNKIEPLGGAYGLFVPTEQPSDKYFIINKIGDYDGRTLLIEKNGNLTDLPGGLCFITNDKKYLFVEHDQDCCGGLQVFDIMQGKVVFCDPPDVKSRSKYRDFESIDYCQKDSSVYIIFNYGDVLKKTFRYDFKTHTLIGDEAISFTHGEVNAMFSTAEDAEHCSCSPKVK